MIQTFFDQVFNFHMLSTFSFLSSKSRFINFHASGAIDEGEWKVSDDQFGGGLRLEFRRSPCFTSSHYCVR